MIPKDKEELRKLVTDTTLETYEELTPQLIYLLNETKKKSRPDGRSENGRDSSGYDRLCQVLYQ